MKLGPMIVTVILMAAAPMTGLILHEMGDNGPFNKDEEDIYPPTTSMSAPLYFLVPPLYDIGGTSFAIQWEGEDDPGGVGLDHFDVQYLTYPSNCYDRGVPSLPARHEWHDLLMGTTETSTRVHVYHGSYFAFRVRGVDKNGNTEDWSVAGDARTIIVEIPAMIYKAILFGHEIREEAVERIQGRFPDDTNPISRVLPLSPIALPEPLVKTMNEDPFILVHPNYRQLIGDPRTDMNDLRYWKYGSIMIRWEGFDPKGSDDIRFDVQYRRVYLESDLVYIPEAPFKPPFMPDATEWTDWMKNTSSNDAMFEIGEPGLYEFRCRAADIHGNVEEYPLAADAFTYVLPMV
ncbi:MAG: hypothetical protein JW939_04055 [Candidatus Thermoplasmatota archaeon]|nr:hypothetical protein [Candidatus Thermoplasmatota archaeon]